MLKYTTQKATSVQHKNKKEGSRLKMGKYYVTKEGYEKLIKDYEVLEEEYRKITSEMGELKNDDVNNQENPAYLENLGKAMHVIPLKQQELNEKLYNAIVIEETEEYKNWDATTVNRKCRLHLLFDGELESYDVLGSNESDWENGILSCEAPLIKELLGRKKGETVQFNGVDVHILKIEKIEDVLKKEESKNKVLKR